MDRDVGVLEDIAVGLTVNWDDGIDVGCGVGLLDRKYEGLGVGLTVGLVEGILLGTLVGLFVGARDSVGACVGFNVGMSTLVVGLGKHCGVAVDASNTVVVVYLGTTIRPENDRFSGQYTPLEPQALNTQTRVKPELILAEVTLVHWLQPVEDDCWKVSPNVPILVAP